jgi:1-aminocyclopropane-1-carboxylate deaminase/D-cysteine desulfhydrase-like pyridoxal-dependent ACC family enzyme
MLELFVRYPRLAERLPHVPLGEFPTPVDELPRPDGMATLGRLFIKRDDRTGRLYGGNKVRKLEFLLADAVRRDAQRVITVGFAGSNHALATAIYARQQGLRCISLLMPQANAGYVRDNLLASAGAGAELHACRSLNALKLAVVAHTARCRLRDGHRPAFIPAGGSSPLGIAGYVNAAFELQAQVAAGILPEPDCLYVAFGSMGTAAGLALGLRAAGMKTRVVAIRVIGDDLASEARFRRHLAASATFLRDTDPGFPAVEVGADTVRIRNEFLGPGYARFTEAGAEAARALRAACGLPANGAYTAKAFAALLADARAGRLDGQVVLFWNTFNSRSLAPLMAGVGPHDLPRPFKRYFTEPVQPLDGP